MVTGAETEQQRKVVWSKWCVPCFYSFQFVLEFAERIFGRKTKTHRCRRNQARNIPRAEMHTELLKRKGRCSHADAGKDSQRSPRGGGTEAGHHQLHGRTTHGRKQEMALAQQPTALKSLPSVMALQVILSVKLWFFCVCFRYLSRSTNGIVKIAPPNCHLLSQSAQVSYTRISEMI